jgi:predicted Zn-dependent protease with MMP-like domain
MNILERKTKFILEKKVQGNDMTRERFEELVNEGIKTIPKSFLEKLDNVGIIVDDKPTSYQLGKLRARKDAIIFGLYEGVPQTKRWCYGQVLPDKITIFKEPIEEYASSEEEIREIIKNTVWHEIAHHFGLDEKKVRELEYHRRSYRQIKKN